MVVCVILELNPRYPSWPLFGFGTDETAKVCLQALVNGFCLAVRLGMVGRGHFQ